ncbi:hypothetical protein [Halorubrum tibetense]|uniref:Uncharacterized protein n=1 Tax=Halorubrum tibetense TaxID=175631 RepID=A0ABD5S9Q4_9EURY
MVHVNDDPSEDAYCHRQSRERRPRGRGSEIGSGNDTAREHVDERHEHRNHHHRREEVVDGGDPRVVVDPLGVAADQSLVEVAAVVVTAVQVVAGGRPGGDGRLYRLGVEAPADVGSGVRDCREAGRAEEQQPPGDGEGIEERRDL